MDLKKLLIFLHITAISFAKNNNNNELEVRGNREVSDKWNFQVKQSTADKWKVIEKREYCLEGCKDKHFIKLQIPFNGMESIHKPKPSIPKGYERLGDLGYYKYYSTELNWLAALHYCAKDHGHLAIVNSLEESKVLVDLVNKHANSSLDYVLIGFHDQFREGVYFTVHSKPLINSGFYIWAKSNPNNVKEDCVDGEQCGSLDREGKLNDICCTLKRPFICEIEYRQ